MPDPKEILERIPGSRPVKRFRGAIVRIRRIPILFYKNKIVVAGVRTQGELKRTIKDLLSLLMGRGLRTSLVEKRIVNITGYISLNRELDLPSLAKEIKGIYDPDYRPYLVARLNNTTLIISQQGKIVVWGAKSMEQITNVINYVLKIFGL